MAELKQLMCKSCSGPISFHPGESVVTCSYCGSTFLYEDKNTIVKVNEHYLVTNKVTSESLQDILVCAIQSTKLAPSDVHKHITILENTGRYLPYWIVNGKATTVYTGKRIETRRIKDSDNEDTTKKEYIPCDGQFQKNHWWPVYGRHMDEFEGFESLKPGNISIAPWWGNYPFGFFGFHRSKTQDHASMRIPYEVDLIDSSIDVVNGQIDRDEAVREARQEIELYSWQKAKDEVSVLQQCETKFKLTEAAFVHIPFWWVTYEYRSHVFCAIIHGHSGELVYLSYPVSGRIKLVISLILTCIFTGIAVLTLSGTPLIIVLALLWLLLIIHGLLLMNEDLQDDREDDTDDNHNQH